MAVIGSAEVRILPNLSGFAASAAAGVKKSGGAIGKAAGVIGKTAGLAAVAGVGIAGKGISDAIGFDKQMREVFTLLPGITDDAMGDMSGQVKDFSKEFGVLPDEVVPALYSSLSAGVPKENVFAFMEVANKAAKGGVTDLETAVDGISGVVNAYGAENISAAETSDLMFTTVKNGKTTMEELSGSLGDVTPLASALGIGFDEVSAAMATSTAITGNTAKSTTGLKGLLSELGKEGQVASDNFKDIAGVAFPEFIAQGNTVGQALTLMEAGAKDSGKSLVDMFGSVEAGQAALQLAADEGKAYGKNLDAMRESAGATDKAFETMDGGLSASIDKLKAFGSVALIEIGEKLIPVIERMVGWIMDEAVPAISEVADEWLPKLQTAAEDIADAFKDAWPTIQEVIGEVFDVLKEAFEFVIGNEPVLIGVLTAIGVAFAAWAVSAAAAAIGTLAAMAPFIAIGAAIAAVVAALVYAYQNWEWFRGAVDAVRVWMVNTLWPAIKTVAEGVVSAFKAMADFVVEAWEWMSKTAKAVWKAIRKAVEDPVGALRKALAKAWNAIKTAASTIWNAIKSALAAIAKQLKVVVLAPIHALRDAAKATWQAMKQAASTVWGALKTAVAGVARALKTAVMAPIYALRDAAKAVWQTVRDTAVRIWRALKSTVTGVVGNLRESVLSRVRGLRDTIKGVWDTIKETASRVWGGIKNAVTTPVQTAKDLASTYVRNLRDNIGTVFRTIHETALRVWGGIKNAVTSPIEAAKEAVMTAFYYVRDNVAGVWNAVKDNISEAIGGIVGIIDGIAGAAQAAIDTVKSLLGMDGGLGSGFTDAVVDATGAPGRALGGPVMSGQTYLVGERGPELFVPRGNGKILPNGQGLGSGPNINITVNGGGNAAEIAAATKKAVLEALARHTNARGRYAA